MDWIESNSVLVGWLVSLSTLMFIGGIILVPVLVARMRADYFVLPEGEADDWTGWSATLRIVLLLVRNTLGAVLLLLGVGMLVLPGQGILTILVGISLMTFPGKRRLELRIARQPAVLSAIQWIRRKAGRPPLEMPDA